MGPVNEAGLRGTLATRDIAEGETFVYIPKELIVEFGAPAHDKPPVSARLEQEASTCPILIGNYHYLLHALPPKT